MSSRWHHFDQENIVMISALKVFIASLGLPVGFLTKSPGSLKKLPGIYKKFQVKNPYNIFIAILVETRTPKRHFVINWPLENESFHMSSKITAIPIFCISTVLQRPDCLRRLGWLFRRLKIPTFFRMKPLQF